MLNDKHPQSITFPQTTIPNHSQHSCLKQHAFPNYSRWLCLRILTEKYSAASSTAISPAVAQKPDHFSSSAASKVPFSHVTRTKMPRQQDAQRHTSIGLVCEYGYEDTVRYYCKHKVTLNPTFSVPLRPRFQPNLSLYVLLNFSVFARNNLCQNKSKMLLFHSCTAVLSLSLYSPTGTKNLFFTQTRRDS